MPMISAAIANNVEQLSQLITKGLDPNFVEDTDGITPLHYAAQYDCLEAVMCLIAAGAKVDAITIDGYSPFDIANINKSFRVLEFLPRLVTTTHSSAN